MSQCLTGHHASVTGHRASVTGHNASVACCNAYVTGYSASVAGCNACVQDGSVATSIDRSWSQCQSCILLGSGQCFIKPNREVTVAQHVSAGSEWHEHNTTSVLCITSVPV